MKEMKKETIWNSGNKEKYDINSSKVVILGTVHFSSPVIIPAADERLLRSLLEADIKKKKKTRCIV